jgi:hypothetical protein
MAVSISNWEDDPDVQRHYLTVGDLRKMTEDSRIWVLCPCPYRYRLKWPVVKNKTLEAGNIYIPEEAFECKIAELKVLNDSGSLNIFVNFNCLPPWILDVYVENDDGEFCRLLSGNICYDMFGRPARFKDGCAVTWDTISGFAFVRSDAGPIIKLDNAENLPSVYI